MRGLLLLSCTGIAVPPIRISRMSHAGFLWLLTQNCMKKLSKKQRQQEEATLNNPSFWIFIGVFFILVICGVGLGISIIISSGTLVISVLYILNKEEEPTFKNQNTFTTPKTNNTKKTVKVRGFITQSDKRVINKSNNANSIIDVTGNSESINYQTQKENSNNSVKIKESLLVPRTQAWEKIREIQDKQRIEVKLVKRKKIELDSALIQEAEQKHSTTVDLLSEYFNDEKEDGNSPNQIQELKKGGVKINTAQQTKPERDSSSIYSISFTPLQLAIMAIFTGHNFSVTQTEIEAFAKSKGVFKNQLIESINETCYEILDDVLIEEEENIYTINQNYYQLLLAK